jgi:hypothetical protein
MASNYLNRPTRKANFDIYIGRPRSPNVSDIRHPIKVVLFARFIRETMGKDQVIQLIFQVGAGTGCLDEVSLSP